MRPVTNQMLNARREPHCSAITPERTYYEVDGSFVKRSLRPREWQHSLVRGMLYIPRRGTEHLLNEAAALRHVAAHTDVPVPTLRAAFQDDEAVYIVTDYVDGVTMAELAAEERAKVAVEVERHLETLRSLTSDTWGGPTGLVVPPWRVLSKEPYAEWKLKRRPTSDLVFCHGDLSAHNVIVDPGTLKVKAIIDWEYAGFSPKEFEGKYFYRPGPSSALDGEVDDVQTLLDVLRENSE